MVDIAGAVGTITDADLQFKVRNDDDPAGWGPAAVPTVEVRSGEGDNGSDRVTIIFPDNAIQKQWLEVTVLKLIELSGGRPAREQASVYDAAMEQAVVRASNVPKTPSARLTWLYEFEPSSTWSPPSKQAESAANAVDHLLATCVVPTATQDS